MVRNPQAQSHEPAQFKPASVCDVNGSKRRVMYRGFVHSGPGKTSSRTPLIMFVSGEFSASVMLLLYVIFSSSDVSSWTKDTISQRKRVSEISGKLTSGMWMELGCKRSRTRNWPCSWDMNDIAWPVSQPPPWHTRTWNKGLVRSSLV